MTVVAGLVSSTAMPRLKLSLTSSGRVLSKQLNANVARKKIRISKPMFGWASVWPHCAKCGRRVAWLESGFKLSARMQNARMKLAAQSAAAVQPGPVAPKKCSAMPLMAGPKINPSPNAMPMRPIRFDRFSGGVMSAM